MKAFILYLIASSAIASTVEIKNQNYIVKKMGSSFFIQEESPSLVLENSAIGLYHEPSKVDCESISKTLKKYHRRIERCTSNASAYQCQKLKKRIEELASSDSIFTGSPLQYWNLKKVRFSDSVNESWLKQILVKKLATSHSQVILQSEVSLSPSMEIQDITITKQSANSRLEMIKPLVSLNNEFSLDEFGVLILTKNRFLACDLQDGSIRISIKIKSEHEHTEKVSEHKKKLGFQIYQDLQNEVINPQNSKEVQAAYLGFKIGSELEKNKFSNFFSIKSIFNSFFNLTTPSIQLKKFSNQNNFEEQIFPNQYFSLDLNQNFSVDIQP